MVTDFKHIPASDEQPKYRRPGPPPRKGYTPSKMPPKWTKGFPRRENCDPNNPYEAFTWMLVALPGQNGGPLVMLPEYLQLVSEHLWELGCRPVEPPTKKYRAPKHTDPNIWTAPGFWVDVNAPDDDDRSPARKAVDSLMPVQKAELLREISKDMKPQEKYKFIQSMLDEPDNPFTAAGGDGDQSR